MSDIFDMEVGDYMYPRWRYPPTDGTSHRGICRIDRIEWKTKDEYLPMNVEGVWTEHRLPIREVYRETETWYQDVVMRQMDCRIWASNWLYSLDEVHHFSKALADEQPHGLGEDEIDFREEGLNWDDELSEKSSIIRQCPKLLENWV